jgi:hypothetical protein
MKSFVNKKTIGSGHIIDVPKLEDAHYAGSAKHAVNCTLILTEGTYIYTFYILYIYTVYM